MLSYFADSALLATGWADSVLIDVDEDGIIAELEPDAESDANTESLAGPVIPGFANAHCESVLRVISGRPELLASCHGALQPWRKEAGKYLQNLGPDELETVHALVYVEMIRQGFTAVGEVQGLHLTPDGGRYDDPAELSERVIAAAHQTGMRLTLLPALDPLGEAGARSVLSVDGLLSLTDALNSRFADEASVRIGLTARSLSAVGTEHLAATVAGLQAQDTMAPIHLPIATDLRDATSAGALLDRRPVDWLLSETPIDGRWCLVHASQITPEEAEQVAATDAVIALSPAFGAALDLPPFPVTAYLGASGKLAVGSGAPFTVGPAEEIRALMTRYRLMDPALHLYERLAAAGAQATGGAEGLATGQPADWVVLEADHPSLLGLEDGALLRALPFATGSSPIRDVMIGGEWVVRDGIHAEEEAVLEAYIKAMSPLAQ